MSRSGTGSWRADLPAVVDTLGYVAAKPLSKLLTCIAQMGEGCARQLWTVDLVALVVTDSGSVGYW